MVKIEDVWELIDWQDSYSDLFPGYSEEENEFSDEYYFDSEKQAREYAEDVLGVFEYYKDQGEIVLYRAITVNDLEDINLDYLGESWSFDRVSAEEFGSHLGGNFVILVGTTSSSNIDWEESLKRYVLFSGIGVSDSENELVVIDSSKIKLLRVENRKGKVLKAGIVDRQLREKQLEKDLFDMLWFVPEQDRGGWETEINHSRNVRDLEKIKREMSRSLMFREGSKDSYVEAVYDMSKKSGVYILQNKNILVIYSHMMEHELSSRLGSLYFDLEHKDSPYFFRATSNPKEHLQLDDFRSFNYRDQEYEKGISVSQHPHYTTWGNYKYIYPIVGDVIGYGADGEPLLQNAKALDKPRKKLLRKYEREYEDRRDSWKDGINSLALKSWERGEYKRVSLSEEDLAEKLMGSEYFCNLYGSKFKNSKVSSKDNSEIIELLEELTSFFGEDGRGLLSKKQSLWLDQVLNRNGYWFHGDAIEIGDWSLKKMGGFSKNRNQGVIHVTYLPKAEKYEGNAVRKQREREFESLILTPAMNDLIKEKGISVEEAKELKVQI